MAFDKPTRNRLAAFVAEARRLITDEFTQQFQSLYGISDASLTELAQLGHLDDAGLAVAGLLRERIDYLVKTHPEDKAGLKAAVDRLAREQAFTVLNRLAAVRMAEKRGLIAESVGNGYQSKGFKVFEQVARSGLGEIYQRYRRYLFCLFDELAIDLGVLFDRRSPQGLLFPRENTLLDLLTLLNGPELEPLWQEDETIGWIYQYYNDPAERKKMREESAAPRNSRELAVRNQFFTPRYVVEFLTDNTLGRIWYEMTRGETRLKEQCRYLVRRPTEIFLGPEETAPVTPEQEGLSQEELLRQPVYIPHRALKDPRELRMLDPACGSMHFGLYAFDLYEVIYEEAWDQGMESLRADFPERDALLREIPRLIIEHNIHGIDIDPRAVQIAGLSLWLRAQRSWQQQRLSAQKRPQIRRSNIVCAESMPGDKAMLREFIASQFATEEQPAFTFLLERVFDRMTLAGEAGSLLKIDEEISEAVREAKRLWQKGPQYEPGYLFAEARPKQPEQLRLDLSGISDEGFWETAEGRIYTALQAYAEQTEFGGYQRRLFAEDAARGFAFIDLCRKRYDATLMNPPYGDPSKRARPYLSSFYPNEYTEIYLCFFNAALRFSPSGFAGALTSRTWMNLSKQFINFRRGLIERRSIAFVTELGAGVLDKATVETSASVFTYDKNNNHPALFFDCSGNEEDTRSIALNEAISQLNDHNLTPLMACHHHKHFTKFPSCTILHGAGSRGQTSAFNDLNENVKFVAKQGLGTSDDFRFIRLRWEVPVSLGTRDGWAVVIIGDQPSRFYAEHSGCLNWFSDGRELKTCITNKFGSATRTMLNASAYFKPGLTYQYTGKHFRVHPLPKDSIITMAGQGLFLEDSKDTIAFLALINTDFVTGLLKTINPGRFFQSGHVNSLPSPAKWLKYRDELEALGKELLFLWENLHEFEETSYRFVINRFTGGISESNLVINKVLTEIKTKSARLEKVCQETYSSESRYNGEPYTVIEAEGAVQASRFLSISLGIAFGRWDIRYATGDRPAPELPDPFASLSICPPGMLQGEDGLPLAAEAGRQLRAAGHYPIDITWDGILVDDPGHPFDLGHRLREVFTVFWQGRSEAIELEACEILGVKSVRDYFRKPSGFFADHLNYYSKSRRQAPIYWPLSTAKGSYTLWIYYHRLSDQTLHTALADFVDPKLKDIRAEISLLRESNNNRSRLEELLDLEGELLDFRAEIERIIKLPWQPNLNDGVLITAAPLWRLFRLPKWQKDLKACWDKLEKGEYDWAHLAYSIWPKRVEEICKNDRSIAIAHGLEHLCQVEPPKPKAKRGRKKAE